MGFCDKMHVWDSDPRGRDRLGEGPVNLRVDHGPAATERGAAGGSLPQLWLPGIMFFEGCSRGRRSNPTVSARLRECKSLPLFFEMSKTNGFRECYIIKFSVGANSLASNAIILCLCTSSNPFPQQVWFYSVALFFTI